MAWSIETPLSDKMARKLQAGDAVELSGVLYAARDAAHRRLVEAIKNKQPLPFDISGQTLYYMGPSPARPGRVIGACGPTTSGRMDMYTLPLLEAGLRAMLGKGERATEVRLAMKKHHAVYLVTYGGAGALLAQSVRKCEVVAFPELGAEAILRLEVVDLPAVVANDSHGGDLFAREIAKYARA